MKRVGHRDHLETGRALSFGADAAAYDRGRPDLPRSLADALVAGRAATVLDVGCGTGKAAVALAQLGCAVLGVEPDAAMAAVARSHGIDVEIARFEEWEANGRRFDLVVAMQAWHWIDPSLTLAKVAEMLTPGGHLAPVTYYRTVDDPGAGARLIPVYRAVAPELLGTSPIFGGIDPEPEIDRHRGAITRSGLFREPIVVRERWDTVLDAATWCDLTASHSDHRALGADRYAALLSGVEEALGGTSVTVAYETIAIVATVRP